MSPKESMVFYTKNQFYFNYSVVFTEQVALKVSALAEGSAICQEAGPISVQVGKPSSSDLASYVTVHNSINVSRKTSTDHFMKHIIEYALEWENIIIAHVTASLKQAEKLRQNLDHYQEKIEFLTLEINRITTKGRVVNERVTTRLQRNDQKFQHARNEYNVFSKSLRTVLEEVIVNGWQNLHPILLKLIQFDISMASDEGELLSNLTPVAESLKRIANECGIQSQAPLKILEKLTALQSQASDTGMAEPKDSNSNLLSLHNQKVGPYGQNDMRSVNCGRAVNLPVATLVR